MCRISATTIAVERTLTRLAGGTPGDTRQKIKFHTTRRNEAVNDRLSYQLPESPAH